MSVSSRELLTAFRAELQTFKLDAYVIPSDDAHSSEYPCDADKRLNFITGFSGSYGYALIDTEEARLWTDARYFLQAITQLEGTEWILMKLGEPDCPTLSQYLIDSKRLMRVGYDPYLYSSKRVQDLEKLIKDGNSQVALVPVHAGTLVEDADKAATVGPQYNLVDAIWDPTGTRPAHPNTPIVQMPSDVSGETTISKFMRLREEMKKRDCDALVMSALDDIAWMTNLRGADVGCSRVFLAYAVVTMEEATVYVKNSSDAGRMPTDIVNNLGSERISLKPYELIANDLQKLAKEEAVQKIWIDSAVNAALTSLTIQALEGKTWLEQPIPVKSWKAAKNEVELHGMIQSHIADGVAVVRYLAWLDNEVGQGLEQMDEVDVSDVLEKFRREQEGFVGLSFDTISGSGPNGAVVHYRAKKDTARKLGSNSMYLVDSGAHYTGGTTDITRTVHLGVPTDFEKEMYTRVLMGHIDLARAIWPRGYKGHHLDSLARKWLWEVGLDFKHGTGHGVGHSLEVHETPPSISPSTQENSPFELGMVVSNEPGVYLTGKFGVRIENLQYVAKADTPSDGDAYFKFVQLTLVPYCRVLIKKELLSPQQIDYLNIYHSHVYRTIGLGRLDGKDLKWLERECAPL